MGVLPAYTIHEYRPDIYKVVAFKRRNEPSVKRLRQDKQRENLKFKFSLTFQGKSVE